MRRSFWLVLPLAALLLCLSGCLFGDVEELLSPPDAPALYQSLQKQIAREQGEGEAIAPLGGVNRQSVQLADLNGDGRLEAVAFFRDESRAETPLRIAVFRQEWGEDYALFASVEGAGNDVHSVDFVDLAGDSCRELLVSWQVSDAVRTSAAYDVSGGEPVELLREPCDGAFAGELDGDGKSEILLARRGTDEKPWTVLGWDQSGSGVKKLGTAPLSKGAEDVLQWKSGTLADGAPAVFAVSCLKENRRAVEVLCLKDGTFSNCALDGETGQSTVQYPDWETAAPADINGDGVTEAPALLPVSGYGDSEGKTFQWLEWRQYRADGRSSPILRTCCGGAGEWYLLLPPRWTGELVQSCKESEGRTDLSIARKGEGKPFLTVTCLTGEDRAAQSKGDGQILLYAGRDRLYTARLFPEVWDCGLDKDSLIKSFRVGAALLNES